ncbi:MAG: hypothetical protein V1779_03395 [bacterium]
MMGKIKRSGRRYKITGVVLFLCLLSLTACFSLREEYPEVHYYRLNQIKSSGQINGSDKVEGTVQIRSFTGSDANNTDRLLGMWDDNRVQVYYYHRWITNASDLITDFIVERYNELGIFTGGVVKPGSILAADYILEGQLLDMVAYNTNDSKQSNYVYISLRVSLIKNEALSTDKKILINKVFSVKQARKNNSAETIAGAFSVALSQISDELLMEIKNAITNNNG